MPSKKRGKFVGTGGSVIRSLQQETGEMMTSLILLLSVVRFLIFAACEGANTCNILAHVCDSCLSGMANIRLQVGPL